MRQFDDATPRLQRLRALLFQLLSVLTIALVIKQAWGFGEATPEAAPSIAEEALTIEARVIEAQSRIVIGALLYFDSQKEEAEQFPLGIEQFKKTIQKVIQGTFEANTPDVARGVLRRQLILSHYLELGEWTEKLQNQLTGDDTNDSTLDGDSSELDALLVQLTRKPPPQASTDDITLLREHLGWMAEPLLASVAASPAEREQHLALLNAATIPAFMKFVVGATMVVVVFSLGVISIGLLLFLTFSKRSERYFRVADGRVDYCLEIFCVYLLAMVAAPFVIKLLLKHGLITSVILANVVGISLLSFLIFWPRLFGVSFEQIKSALGFRAESFWKSTKDALLAPICYSAGIIVLLSLLVVYSIVLQHFNVDVTRGAHPIVPLLLENGDTATLLYVALLAVVIAPFVEEIMFRGALYGWLRARISMFPAIVVSSAIFAAVHPQGAIGFFPLFVIACGLAAIREWRGSLLCSALVHACVNAGTLTLVLLFLR